MSGKQPPRTVRLSMLGGRLTGLMEIPLGLDRIRLPIPPSTRIWVGNGRDDVLDVPTSGLDYIEFETTRRWEVSAEHSYEIFTAVDYGGAAR